jgi:outer membrane receptor protein involved in Fe transport
VDTYSQGSAQRENVRNTGIYVFAQDSWKVKQNLTFNYGLRWELDTPLTDALGHVQTFRPGQTSTAYPCTMRIQMRWVILPRWPIVRPAWSFLAILVFRPA